jgi:3-phosphoshikimate 1-carboxyvinyltransferase
MKTIIVEKIGKGIDTTIELPASKSISNRALIIQSLSKRRFKINNLSEASDTVMLQEILDKIKKGKENTFNVGDGGTTYRFLTAYLAFTPGRWFLASSERMHERPIAPLVDTLRQLGAVINYIDKDGFPPLEIIGGTLKGGKVSIDASISSQFISSLLMIAPMLEDGLELTMTTLPVSSPYIKMTLKMMEYFGIKHKMIDNTITIRPQKYKSKEITIEADWTAASYWYEILAFNEDGTLFFPGLQKDSLQGDAIVETIYKTFGIETTFEEHGVRITYNKTKKNMRDISETFLHIPDLAPTLFATCAGVKTKGIFWGLDTLKHKESDRLEAGIKELKKFGIETETTYTNTLYIPRIIDNPISPLSIKTYNDHRMAMAFAPLCIPYGKLTIENPDVVKKSYPNFWEDLKKAGFEITETK